MVSWRGFLNFGVVNAADDKILEIVRCPKFVLALKSVFELVARVVLIIFLKIGLRVKLSVSWTLLSEALAKVAFYVNKKLLERLILLVSARLIEIQLVL